MERSLPCPALPCAPQTVFRILTWEHCQTLTILTASSFQTTGATSPRLKSPGPQRSSSLLDMGSPRAAVSFHPGPCTSEPRPSFKGCPQTCISIPHPLPVPGFLLGIGGPCADIWRGAARGVSSLRTGHSPAPLTCAEKGKPQGPHGHPSPESQGSALAARSQDTLCLGLGRLEWGQAMWLHGRSCDPSGKSHVQKEESPLKTRCPESENIRGKWKLAASLAGLFQEPFLVSQCFSCACGWISNRRPQAHILASHPPWGGPSGHQGK